MKSFTQRTIDKCFDNITSIIMAEYPSTKQGKLIKQELTKALQDYAKEIEKELDGMKATKIRSMFPDCGDHNAPNECCRNKTINDFKSKFHQLTGSKE